MRSWFLIEKHEHLFVFLEKWKVAKDNPLQRDCIAKR
jgi:hypothetical protein